MDDAALIDQVASFSFLYDKKEPKFKNKIVKENAWQTIGLILDHSPTACEQRWVVLRAKYTGLRRQLRTIPSGSEAVRNSWPLFDAMGFLDPYLTTRNTTTNFVKKTQPKTTKSEAWNTLRCILNDDEYVDDETQSQDSQALEETETSVEEVIPDNKTPKRKAASPQPPTSKQSCKIPRDTLPSTSKKRSLQESMYDKMGNCFETLTKKLNTSENAQDMSFVKSLVLDMEELTTKEKIIFKKQIYVLLAEIIENRDD